MATIGRTLFRFTGAVLLGVSATSIDNPRILVPVYKGEAIVPGRLAPYGTAAGIGVRITPGKRAFGIRVDDVAGIAGLVQPNSRVDIILVIEDAVQSRLVAKLFMENMRVLAIGPAPEPASEDRSLRAAVASIEVTPVEAERLAIAAAQGALQLVLRGYGDPDSMTAGGQVPARGHVPLRDLLLRKSQSAPRSRLVVPPKRVRPDSFALEVFRGRTGADELQFAKDSAARADSLRSRP